MPSVWYLIQPQLQPKKGHGQGHGHGDEGHSEEHGEEHVEGGEHGSKDEGGEKGSSGEGEGPSDEKTGKDVGDGEEKAGEDGSEEGGNDEESSGGSAGEGSEKKVPATPADKGPDVEAHETESGGDVEGVQFKGSTSGGTKEGEQGDTRKHIPDAKGGSKKRIESDYAKPQGQASEPEQDPDNKDVVFTKSQFLWRYSLTRSQAAASKATGKAGSSTTQSSKQEGLSNTDTKHSTDIQNSPEKSKKGEGMPETAKSKGTVDPFRKQV